MKNTYQVYIQYEAVSCRHRHGIIVYVRATTEEDAIKYAREIPHSNDYTIRKVSVKMLEVYEVA